MREKVIKVYTVKELDADAKEHAYEEWWKNDFYGWYGENTATLEKFCEVFPVKVTNYEYGPYGPNFVSFHMTTDQDEVENLSGQRLATYIWNNYGYALFKGKYYSKPMMRNEDGTWKHKHRYSKIILETSCVLTGYWIDMEILAEVYDFLKKPDSRTFRELMDDCFHGWTKAASADIEASRSMEAFEEDAEANGWEFEEDGTIA